MRSDNSEKRLTHWLMEFEKIDQFYESFSQQLLVELEHVGVFVPGRKNETSLSIVGVELAGVVDSLMDKDVHYPGYRIQEELERLNHFKKYNIDKDIVRDLIFQKVKEVIVEFFPQIIELSGNGLRVLDLYARMFCSEIDSLLKN